MNSARTLTRRRVLAIAASATVASFPAFSRTADAAWQGVAMGADASIRLQGFEAGMADRLLALCTAEVARLERIFSLFARDSSISRLNRTGHLEPAPEELRELLILSRNLNSHTGGAFDPTVQSLWIADGKAVPAQVLGMDKVQVDGGSVRLKNGAQITLNGIAQGYMTDRISNLLKDAGARHVLVNLGEYRAIGSKETGEPWVIGLRDPDRLWRTTRNVELEDRALATSASTGFLFGRDLSHHHLFDPRTGGSANHHRSVSVLAPTAALADGLSTALSALTVEEIPPVLTHYPEVDVHLTRPDGESLFFGNG